MGRRSPRPSPKVAFLYKTAFPCETGGDIENEIQSKSLS